MVGTHVNVNSVLVVDDAAHAREGRINRPLAFVERSLLERVGQRTRVWQHADVGDLVVAATCRQSTTSTVVLT